jgi:3-hydroxybutyryl-CoA dehydrogenase
MTTCSLNDKARQDLNPSVWDKGRLQADAKQAALERSDLYYSINDLADCDLVIEAIVEDMRLRESCSRLRRYLQAETILASNTPPCR